MNKYLKTAEDKPAAPRASADPLRPVPLPSRNRKPWINWVFVLGIIFGAYAFLGQYVLQDKYTWPVIFGNRQALTEKTVIEGTAEAKAAAEALAAKRRAEETLPVDVQKAVETAKGVLPVEVEKAGKAAAAAKDAEIEPTLKLTAEKNKLDVARAAETEAATSYQKCVDKVAASAIGAVSQFQSIDADPKKPSMMGASTVAYDLAMAQGMATCEPFKEARDKAILEGRKVEESLSKSNETQVVQNTEPQKPSPTQEPVTLKQ